MTAAIRSDKDAYFILGVEPPEAMVMIKDGAVVNGRFEAEDSISGPLFVPFLGFPKDGYIVFPAHEGRDTLAMCELGKQFVMYGPREGGMVLVFHAIRGKIAYIADVRGEEHPGIGGSLTPHFSRGDLEKARAHLTTHYPALADRLEMGTYEVVPVKDCATEE